MPVKAPLRMETRDPKSLKPYKNNPRKHSKKQIRQIAKSYEQLGENSCVTILEDGTVLSGHARVEAAKLLGMTEIHCLVVDLTEEEARLFVLAANQLGLTSEWDMQLLAGQVQAVIDFDGDITIDVAGFSVSEIDTIIEFIEPEEPNDPGDDLLPDVVVNGPEARPGDIWQLGKHRLICGDALNPETFERLMDGKTSHMILTDPPYNITIPGNVGGLGKVKHEDFKMASGEMSRDRFTEFLKTSLGNSARVLKDGGICFVFIDWRHLLELQLAGEAVFDRLMNVITWVKDNGGMGTFYRSRHEFIFAFKKGTAPHTNSFELGQNGRYRTNVWEYKGMNSRGKDRDMLLKLHPTVKPVQMLTDAIRDVSMRGEIVLDPFAGSGSTLIAAHKTGRRAYVAELEPKYCSIIIARWQDYANDEAVLIHRNPDEAKCASAGSDTKST